VQESSSRLRIGERLGRIKPSRSLKEPQEIYVWNSEEGVANLRRRQLSTMEKPLGKKLQESLGREETDDRNSLWRIREIS
jgi:hypothetical protein